MYWRRCTVNNSQEFHCFHTLFPLCVSCTFCCFGGIFCFFFFFYLPSIVARVKLWVVFDGTVEKLTKQPNGYEECEVNVLICRIQQLDNCACWNVQFSKRWFTADSFVQIHKCRTTQMLLKILTDDCNNILTSDNMTHWHLRQWRITVFNARIKPI